MSTYMHSHIMSQTSYYWCRNCCWYWCLSLHLRPWMGRKPCLLGAVSGVILLFWFFVGLHSIPVLQMNIFVGGYVWSVWCLSDCRLGSVCWSVVACNGVPFMFVLSLLSYFMFVRMDTIYAISCLQSLNVSLNNTRVPTLHANALHKDRRALCFRRIY